MQCMEFSAELSRVCEGLEIAECLGIEISAGESIRSIFGEKKLLWFKAFESASSRNRFTRYGGEIDMRCDVALAEMI